MSASPHLRESLHTVAELAVLPPARPLVDGLLFRGTLAQLAGAPGSYKSFLALAMACSVAAGVPFEGHRVPEAGTVLYVAAEGASGLRIRILAWCEHNQVDPADLEGRLLVLPTALALADPTMVAQAVEVAAEKQVVLTVLDTRSRCTTGLEENSATDMSLAIGAAERIQRASDGTVLVVHHTGRGGEHGRGSNAWDGAVWSDLRLRSDELRAVIHCEKHKDVAAGCDHAFRLVPRVVPPSHVPRERGEGDGDYELRRSTLVVVQTGTWTDQDQDRRSTRTILDIIGTTGGAEGLSRSQIVAFAEERNIGRSTAYQAVNTLTRSAEIRNVGTSARPRYVLCGLSVLPGGAS